MSRCRSCGEEIDFVRLRSGKLMPVEAATTETYYLHVGAPGVPHMALVTEDGDILRGRLGKQHETGVTKIVGSESHFSRCGDAGPSVNDA